VVPKLSDEETLSLARKILAENPLASEQKLDLAQRLMKPLMPVWGKAPPGTQCSMCGKEELERSYIPIGNAFSGSVRCLSCGHCESVMSHIGRNMIKVEPLPPGAVSNYYGNVDNEEPKKES
jgi:hypothetical protein